MIGRSLGRLDAINVFLDPATCFLYQQLEFRRISAIFELDGHSLKFKVDKRIETFVLVDDEEVGEGKLIAISHIAQCNLGCFRQWCYGGRGESNVGWGVWASIFYRSVSVVRPRTMNNETRENRNPLYNMMISPCLRVCFEDVVIYGTKWANESTIPNSLQIGKCKKLS